MAAAATRRLVRWLSVRLESFLRALRPPRPSPPLRALTAAALMLPGLAVTSRADEGDGFAFQYGEYQEGKRDLDGIHSDFHPIRVDSLSASGKLTVTDRLRLGVAYAQDTWSGATPIATAPLVFGGNHPTKPDGVSGATPYIEGDLFLDGHLRPVRRNSLGEFLGVDTRLVHTLSSASPEARRQMDLSLEFEGDDFALRAGGGTSLEKDYEAGYGSLGGTLDFAQKRTSVSFDASYTRADVDALLDHDAVPYIDVTSAGSRIHNSPGTGERRLRDERTDWALQAGLNQVLTRDAFFSTSLGFTRSQGYLANPYKVVEVGFIDPEQQFLAPPGGFYAQVHALLERRPSSRSQWVWDTRFVQYLAPLDASLHLGYRYFRDDWGIGAHTFELSLAQPLPRGWTVTPRFRYYSQDAARFYTPYLLTPQAYQTVVSDPDTGDIISITPFDPRRLPGSYSSDQRLSGFGALSAGVTLDKLLDPGVRLSASFEYYRHDGGLKLGGGGESSFADYDAYLVGASITLDSNALTELGRAAEGHEEHLLHAAAPAGVMLAHMLTRPGAFMVAYESWWSSARGDLLRGSRSASDAEVLALGCEGVCRTAPSSMEMHMHMLELMYAPTDWLNLMLMPQFVDNDMDLRPLQGAVPDLHAHDHATGGVGDIGMYALFKLLDSETQHVHFGLGLSAPTGAVDIRERREHQQDQGFTHYMMQLGSGTWDLMPSLTYTGALAPFSWGAQVGGVTRLEHANESGYALGDVFQASVWGGWSATHWLSFTLRGIYGMQRAVQGRYDALHTTSGPQDFPGSYGGQYWDLGIGASALLPFRSLSGNRVGVEWLQPLLDDQNGFQLERRGTLVLRWSIEL
jgi:hypothetical protein